MIKVIFKNNRIRCNKCKSVLKYNTEDIKEAKYSDGSHREYYIECPVCKNGVEVSTNYYKNW